ncbi:MAG TPA: tetratricopeptide repeat protein [Candidatus Didemnitutus sp.]|nr:tetratricopeptide repeat protein [Candidatus Didemnitutus sp.]
MPVTTKRARRPALWIMAGVGGAILVAGALVWRTRPDSRLGPEVSYAQLPAEFAQALQKARVQVRDADYAPADLRRLATLYLANGLGDEARRCFALIARSPGGLTGQDHYLLADLDRRAGDLAEAQRELQATVAASPDYRPARLALAEVLFKSGQSSAAKREYATILQAEPDQPQAAYGLARIQLQDGDDDAAVATLEELMASHPEATAAAGLFAQVLDRRGESDRAAAMTEWSRQKPEPIPADPWLDGLLEDCYDRQRLSLAFEDYAKTGQMDRAVPLIRRVEELDPRSSVPPLLRGWSAAQSHNDAEAVTQYREALARGGDPEKICPYLVQSLRTLNRDGEAASLLAEYYTKLPDSIPIVSAYAEVALARHDEALARTLLTKALAKEPYLYSANVSLGKILWAAGERQAAAQCLQRIATIYSTDIPSRVLLGEYYLGRSDAAAAIKPLEQAAALIDRKSPLAPTVAEMLGRGYFSLGQAEVAAGHLEPAANYFGKLVGVQPDDARGLAAQATVLVQARHFDRAVAPLEKLAALQPANPTIFLSLGDVWYQQGNPDNARRNWLRARELTSATEANLGAALARRLDGRIDADTFK